jgi:hypothetical protein
MYNLINLAGQGFEVRICVLEELSNASHTCFNPLFLSGIPYGSLWLFNRWKMAHL